MGSEGTAVASQSSRCLCQSQCSEIKVNEETGLQCQAYLHGFCWVVIIFLFLLPGRTAAGQSDLEWLSAGATRVEAHL